MQIQTGLRLVPMMLLLLVGNAVGQNDDRADALALMERAFHFDRGRVETPRATSKCACRRG